MSVSMSMSRVSQRSSSGGAGAWGAGGGGGYGLGLSSGMSSLSLGGGGGGGAFSLGLGGGGGGGGGYGGMGGGSGGGFGFGGGDGIGGGSSPAFAMGRALMSTGLSHGSAQGFGGSFSRPGAGLPSSASVKQTLSGLNDRFHSYVEKVKQLQLENKTLQAQLDHLTGGAPVSAGGGDSSTPVNYEAQLTDLRINVENLTLENIRHEIELDNIRGAAEELKAKHDFELGVKFQLETDIGAMKRDIEFASEIRTDLEQRYTSALDELDYVKKTHEEEVSSLQTQLGTTTDKSVSLIEVDAVRSFDITKALKEMRASYEQSVKQHKEDAQRFYEAKMAEIQNESAKNTEVISTVKGEIAATKKEIQTLSIELQGLLSLNYSLEGGLAEASASASVGVAESQAQISSYEAAIESGKVELHKVIMNYQELLDIKQALDVEIATYRKLLEGEDLKFPELEALSGACYTFTSEGGFRKKNESSLLVDDF